MTQKLVTTTISDLYQQNKLEFSRGRYNILDCGVRTGKTYWALNHLQAFTRDGEARRILFLVDTLALKSSLLEQYPDHCCDADIMWQQEESSWSVEDYNKIGVMCYQTLGMAVLRDETNFLDSIDVICWDECDSIFDFAASAFAKARRTDFSRADSTNEEILTLIQQHSTRKEYMPLILLGFWEQLVYGNRILCIGLSASPERARMYYASLTRDSYKGKIYTSLRATSDIYFKNIIDHINELTPMPNVGYWCYSPSIQHNRATVQAALNRGFKAIEIHSVNNHNEPLTEEQLNVIDCVTKLHMVPIDYDFVVVTRAFERGIDIIDPRFQHLIVDSYYQEDRIQAARQTFPYQRHVKVLTEEVPAEYKNRWLTLQECRDLAEYMAVPDIDINNAAKNRTQTRIMSWNKLQDLLPSIGYTVEKKRKRVAGSANSAICYMITGDWHDVELVADKGFMQLVAAKNESQTLDNDAASAELDYSF